MKISTFSIVVGTSSCDAGCSFCISKSTGLQEVGCNDIQWEAFGRAVAMAKQARTTTVLFTGKGEPTLYPLEVTAYLRALWAMGEHREFVLPMLTDDGQKVTQEVHLPAFSTMELQTNAILIGQLAQFVETFGSTRFRAAVESHHILATTALLQIRLYRALLEWKKLGLTTIAISTVGVKQGWNQQVYLHGKKGQYPDLALTVQFLHDLGFQVRICVMMQKGFVESAEQVGETVIWCRDNKVEQLTVRPIRRPEHKPIGELTEADAWVDKHGLEPDDEASIEAWVKLNGVRIYTFTAGDHEFHVYDIYGQNLCLADCLTVPDGADTIRTLILYPRTGEIKFHWQFESARL